jgi:hypothetical protein
MLLLVLDRVVHSAMSVDSTCCLSTPSLSAVMLTFSMSRTIKTLPYTAKALLKHLLLLLACMPILLTRTACDGQQPAELNEAHRRQQQVLR